MAYRVNITDFLGFKTRVSQKNAPYTSAVDGVNFVLKPDGLESIRPVEISPDENLPFTSPPSDFSQIESNSGIKLLNNGTGVYVKRESDRNYQLLEGINPLGTRVGFETFQINEGRFTVIVITTAENKMYATPTSNLARVLDVTDRTKQGDIGLFLFKKDGALYMANIPNAPKEFKRSKIFDPAELTSVHSAELDDPDSGDVTSGNPYTIARPTELDNDAVASSFELDIALHFQQSLDSNPRFRGADGAILVTHARTPGNNSLVNRFNAGPVDNKGTTIGTRARNDDTNEYVEGLRSEWIQAKYSDSTYALINHRRDIKTANANLNLRFVDKNGILTVDVSDISSDEEKIEYRRLLNNIIGTSVSTSSNDVNDDIVAGTVDYVAGTLTLSADFANGIFNDPFDRTRVVYDPSTGLGGGLLASGTKAITREMTYTVDGTKLEDIDFFDFSKSETRMPAEGFVQRQPEGTGPILSLKEYNGDIYAFKKDICYVTRINDEDEVQFNRVFRRNIGVEGDGSLLVTAEGIIFIDTSRRSQPTLRVLTKDEEGESINTHEFKQDFDFSKFDFSNARMIEHNDDILILCRRFPNVTGTDITNLPERITESIILSYSKITKEIDVLRHVPPQLKPVDPRRGRITIGRTLDDPEFVINDLGRFEIINDINSTDGLLEGILRDGYLITFDSISAPDARDTTDYSTYWFGYRTFGILKPHQNIEQMLKGIHRVEMTAYMTANMALELYLQILDNPNAVLEEHLILSMKSTEFEGFDNQDRFDGFELDRISDTTTVDDNGGIGNLKRCYKKSAVSAPQFRDGRLRLVFRDINTIAEGDSLVGTTVGEFGKVRVTNIGLDMTNYPPRSTMI